MTTLDTGTDDLQAAVDDGVAVLTLNRPERRNAFSPAMINGLAHMLTELERDESVGVIVLTGAGGAFCAGGDVKAMASDDALFGPQLSYDDKIALQRLSQRATAVKLWYPPSF